MLLRKHPGVQQVRLRACAIVPSQALIPHCTRPTLVAWSCLCISDIAFAGLFQPVLRTKCQRWNEITNAVTVYLCKDMVPFQNDRKGFKEMVKTLVPRYALPGRTHFSQIEMPKLYGKARKQVEKQIQTIKHQCFSEMEVTWILKRKEKSMQFCCLTRILPL